MKSFDVIELDVINRFTMKRAKKVYDRDIVSFVSIHEKAVLTFLSKKNLRWTNWRVKLSYNEDFSLWSEGYRRGEDFVRACPEQLRKLVIPFSHMFGEIYHLALAVDRVSTRIVNETVIMPTGYSRVLKSHKDYDVHLNAVAKHTKLERVMYILKRISPYNIQRVFQPVIHWRRDFFFKSRFWIRQDRRLHVIVIEDSGTNVNLNPGIKLLKELRRRGEDYLVITMQPHVAKKLFVLREPYWFVQQDYWTLKNSFRCARMMRAWLERSGRDAADSAISKYLRQDWSRFLCFEQALSRVWRTLLASGRPMTVLTINETTPSGWSLGLKAQAAGIEWLGFWPILLGNRPDCTYFPADRHLVYGKQLTDLVEAHRKEHFPHQVREVGSATYECDVQMDKEVERKKVSARFGLDASKKWIVIATECFPNPEVELGPIIKILVQDPALELIVKMHPSDHMEDYQRWIQPIAEAASAKLTWIEKTDLDSLLCAADILVCIISNIIIKAAQHGTPTISCDWSGKTEVLSFADYGLAFGCSSIEQFESTFNKTISGELKSEATEKLRKGILNFNAHNDGQSSRRIVDEMIQHARRPDKQVYEEWI